MSLLLALAIWSADPALADALHPPAALEEKWEEAKVQASSIVGKAQHKIVETRVALLGEGARRSVFHTLEEILASAWKKAKKAGRRSLLSLADSLDEADSK